MKRIAFAVCMGALVLSGCGGSNASSNYAGGNSLFNAAGRNEKQREEMVAKATKALEQGPSAQVAEAINAFGFSLFDQVLAQEKDPNVMVSPLSASMALSMTYNGADGETKKQMAKVLGYAKLSNDQVNEAYKYLRELLANADPKVNLQIANSLWAKEGVTFKPSFITQNRTYYDAKVTSLDFNKPEAKKTINDWVKDSTGGKIPTIIDGDIPPAMVMYLINAVYFKGYWAKPFDSKLTKDAPFTIEKGTSTVPLMNLKGSFPYYKGDGVEAVSLPYGSGRLSMVAVLPPKGKSVREFAKTLDAKAWTKVTKGLAPGETDVFLPRFKSETDAVLNDALKALGMPVAFDAKADFSGMRAEKDIFIDTVKQKIFIETNEEGSEAAAATSVGMTLSAAPADPKVFRADRPFLYAIRDTQTGLILFMGIVSDPSK